MGDACCLDVFAWAILVYQWEQADLITIVWPRRGMALLLAAACNEGELNDAEKTFSNPCYAFNLTYNGPTATASAPPAAELESAGLHRSHLVHNAFVGRTAELRELHRVLREHCALRPNGMVPPPRRTRTLRS